MTQPWIVPLFATLSVICQIFEQVNPFANLTVGTFYDRLIIGLLLSQIYYIVIIYGLLLTFVSTQSKWLNIPFLIILVLNIFNEFSLMPLIGFLEAAIRLVVLLNIPPFIQLILYLCYSTFFYLSYGMALGYAVSGTFSSTKEKRSRYIYHAIHNFE